MNFIERNRNEGSIPFTRSILPTSFSSEEIPGANQAR